MPLTEFTPLQSLAGGLLIGLGAVILMAANGRIAGMTGILGGLLPPGLAPDRAWRVAFLAGAIATPVVYLAAGGLLPALEVPVSRAMMLGGGFIVGVGVVIGAGCTSGHGVCGLARLSPRSLAATLTFMVTTAGTVFVVRHLVGG
jgi:uncharacterized protein